MNADLRSPRSSAAKFLVQKLKPEDLFEADAVIRDFRSVSLVREGNELIVTVVEFSDQPV